MTLHITIINTLVVAYKVCCLWVVTDVLKKIVALIDRECTRGQGRTTLRLFECNYAPELTTKEFLQCLWEGTSVSHRQAQMTL